MPAVLQGEVAGLAGQQGGLPLADPAPLERGQGVRHLVHQDLRQAEVALPQVRGAAAGERDLAGDPEPDPPLRDPGGLLGGALGGVEVGGQPRLRGRGGGLEPLQLRDLVDSLGVGGVTGDLDQVVDPTGERGRGQPLSTVGRVAAAAAEAVRLSHDQHARRQHRQPLAAKPDGCGQPQSGVTTHAIKP